MFYSLYQGNNTARATAWIIGMLGLIGNGCIIIYSRKKNLLKVSNKGLSTRSRQATRKSSVICNYLIFNLAIADLLGDLYLTIIVSADTYYGINYPVIYQTINPVNETNIWIFHPFCHIGRFFYFTSTILSILITLVIAVDRFVSVIFPISKLKLNLQRCRIIMLICWILASSFGLYPTIRGFINVNLFTKMFWFPINACLYEDTDEQLVTDYINAKYAIFYTCSCLVCLCYIFILIHVKTKSKSSSATQSEAIQRHILLIMIAVTISNIGSLLPSTVMFELYRLNTPFTLYDYMLTVGTIITFVNTAVNPIIYMVMSPSLTRKLFKCCKVRFYIRNRVNDASHCIDEDKPVHNPQQS
ncbi:G-protein coupled receptor GRL101-like protein [Trichoplax sp. H2]|nr:G-protein coupled receptor GRL101-like protein [Trichoplax sp. H2]|eukprot:RDD47554.1 G-protein coupled receptor GRL101-like protein [Trichoplax sp. H2]